MTDMTITLRRDDNPNEIIGWVRPEVECENRHCKRAVREGRPWHAIPAGFATTLPDYHFRTESDARQAVLNRMRDVRGLRMDLPTAERCAWMRDND
jgi:hypothetical protein